MADAAPAKEASVKETPSEGNPPSSEVAAEATQVKSKASENRPGGNDQPPNACKKCCSSLMSIFAHHSIYGSFVGPHPVTFCWLCSPCKRCCNRNCARPFCVASIATKIMYFIMLGVVTLLACFFIIPWPLTAASNPSTSIASFYPCGNGKMIRYEYLNGGCFTHAGYFMVYRCFFAFGTLMLTNSLIMMYVFSTKEDTNRAAIHQGFWLYKYLYLFGLLMFYFLFLNGQSDSEGVFEYFCSIVGNIAHMVFSILEITFVLDLVELWTIQNEISGSNWANCFYWTNTGLISLAALLMFIYICNEFSMHREFPPGKDYYPMDNCEAGTKVRIDWAHFGMIVGSVSVVAILVIVMIFLKNKIVKWFPYTGWLQVSILTLFNFSYLWSSLYSSPMVHSRPRCNLAFKKLVPTGTNPLMGIQEGSTDVYFRISGFYHGIFVILALLYYTFVHGPRSKTAPLSRLYNGIFSKARIPVFPDEETSPTSFDDAVDKLTVWDDEKEGVSHSWSMFYAVMVFGALSLMMAMTNFTNPWAQDRYNSSYVAFGCKFASSIIATFLFIICLLRPCSQIFPETKPYEVKRRRVMKRKLASGELVDATESTAASQIVEIEEDEGSTGPVEVTSRHQPKTCGCMM